MGRFSDNDPQRCGTCKWASVTRAKRAVREIRVDTLTAEMLGQAAKFLGYRERRVLELRAGVGCRPHTLDEVGAAFSITREGVRQIQRSALTKIMLMRREEAHGGG